MTLESIFKNVSEIKLPGGAVGKVSQVLIFLAVSIVVICWLAHNIYVDAALGALLLVLCFIILWRLITFASKHPQAALLEGAEFLVHEQIKYGMKTRPELPVKETDFKLGKPIPPIPEAEVKRMLEAEEEPPETPSTPEGGGKNA